jgi:predicted nucleic acid-binding protein
VLAELYAGGPDGEKVAEELIKRQMNLRVHAFEIEAARLSGQITAVRLKERGSVTRAVVKFDAMVAAAAASSGATHILTADSDIAKCVALLPLSKQMRVIELP